MAIGSALAQQLASGGDLRYVFGHRDGAPSAVPGSLSSIDLLQPISDQYAMMMQE